ncbi:MAG: hypothetical protein NC548_21960 [Lachnospiraceae bacterium]|nr:hypothetical protein [Lachnospiraceae bacterium]
MTVLVSQLDNEYASKCVRIFANGKQVGHVGPGESFLVKTDAVPATILAVCGFCSAQATMHADGELSIRWSINAPYIELVQGKGR